MGDSFQIAGVERSPNVLLDSISIEQVLTSAVDTCSFSIRDIEPHQGDEVIITIGGKRAFGGIIDAVKLASRQGSTTIWDVDCQDYTFQLNRRLVIETYESQTVDWIVKDIITKYGQGLFTVEHVRPFAPVVQRLVFDYLPPSECLKKLADYCGWEWYIDYFRDVWFFDPTEENQVAPMVVDVGAKVRNPKFSIDAQGLRNRVFVKGGTMLSDPFVYETVADGQARVWNLPHKPHNLTLTISGAPKTVGLENVDNEAIVDFLVNTQEKYVKASLQTAAPANGATMSFTYQYEIAVISTVDDYPSQIAIAAVQGGDGIYEHVITDTSLTTVDAAEAAGQADLRLHANPKVSGSFETGVPGWAPGQLVAINLPSQGVANTFTVQKVTTKPLTPDTWSYTVEYGGRLIGIPDFLKAIVSSQQSQTQLDNVVLNKLVYGNEEILVADQLVTTPFTLPYQVEVGIAGKCDPADSWVQFTETTQADFAQGTLTNTVAGDGNLALLDHSYVYFNGLGNYVDFETNCGSGYLDNYLGNDRFTVEVKVIPEIGPSPYTRWTIFGREANPYNSAIYYTSDQRFQVEWAFDYSSAPVSTLTLTTANTFAPSIASYMVSFVCDTTGKMLYLYVNGVLEASGAFPNPGYPSGTQGTWRMGLLGTYGTSTSCPFKGLVYEMRVYYTNLTQATIQSYLNTVDTAYTYLVGLWKAADWATMTLPNYDPGAPTRTAIIVGPCWLRDVGIRTQTFNVSTMRSVLSSRVSWSSMTDPLVYDAFTADTGQWVNYNAGAVGMTSYTYNEPSATDGKCFVVDGGMGWYYSTTIVPFFADRLYIVKARVRQQMAPVSGGAKFSLGLEGVAADGVTLVNQSGDNGHNTMYFYAANDVTLDPASGWAEYTGYFKGVKSASIDSTTHPDFRSPGQLTTGVAYVRPVFIVNAVDGSGVAQIDYLKFGHIGRTVVETNLSLDGGSTWAGWNPVTNGGSIPGVTGVTNLSNARLQVRQTLYSDFEGMPQLNDFSLAIEGEPDPIASVGSLLWITPMTTDAVPDVQIATSVTGTSYTEWTSVPLNTTITVPFPGYFKLRSPAKVRYYNFKIPFAETTAVCNEVVVAA
ncbi:LamG-like jellyroll fold domain-containing protein [Heliophilum fasciatum]|uniref:Concanavalin A-like lectin/glucanase superfamily protein n=1 Tax=Heliophilum fasciatum TaxID=35700 RepID=A0A4R2RCW0_9FIRM|nr:LamG-like jellyroll fold domain-containing protein [Heliophilum fasciatum]MCW2279112.1 hypothetical protein [Heliophilum fasciatum]TCP61260.1 concanavalin A-like lectin/glucanase superfamily protein [Heliophilum fasciatum]